MSTTNFIQYLTYQSISAKCSGLDPEKHKNMETTATFPVSHGDAIVVSCKAGHIKSADNVALTCIDGTEFSQKSQLTCTAG